MSTQSSTAVGSAIAMLDRRSVDPTAFQAISPIEAVFGVPIASGTNAVIYRLDGADGDRVLRVAPTPDRFLLYAALLGAELARFAGGPAPRIVDLGFAGDGTMVCEVERLRPLPDRFADAGSLHEIARAMGVGRFHDLYRLIDRLDVMLLDIPGQFSGLDLEQEVVAGNLMLRPGPGRQAMPVLTDPLGGEAVEADFEPVRRRRDALARRWPSWAATSHRLSLAAVRSQRNAEDSMLAEFRASADVLEPEAK